jgi:hypothetical protein
MDSFIWRPLFPPIFLLLLFVVALPPLIWQLARMGDLYVLKQKITLFILRLLPLALIIIFALGPTFKTVATIENKAGLVFLLDASESMNVSDMPDGQSRWAAAGLRMRKQWWHPLSHRYDVSAFSFSSFTSPLEPEDTATQQSVAGKSTDIGGAIEKSLGSLGGTKPAAIVLLSDGNHNVGINPVGVASEGVPVYAVGMGLLQAYQDIEIVRVSQPPVTMVGEKITLKVDVQAFGYDYVRAKMQVSVQGPDGELTDAVENPQRDMELRKGMGAKREEFIFTPKKKGKYCITAQLVDQLESDNIPTNDSKQIEVEVLQKAIKILVLNKKASQESRFMYHQALVPDRRFQVLNIIPMGSGTIFPQYNYDAQDDLLGISSNPLTIDFSPFHCVILMDTPSNLLTDDNWRLLAGEVAREGKSLVILVGDNSSGEHDILKSPLGDILPALTGKRGGEVIKRDAELVPTEEGYLHPLMTFIRDLMSAVSEKEVDLPLKEVQRTLPDPNPDDEAMVLARVSGDTREPILIYQNFKKGHSLVVAKSDTWQWFYLSDEDDPLQLAYLSFWRNTVRWMTTGHINPENKRIQLLLEKEHFTYGESVPIRIMLHGFEKIPQNLRIEGHVETPEGIEMPLSFPPPQMSMQMSWTPRSIGRFTIKLRLMRDAETIDKVEVPFSVDAYTAERLVVGINEELMKEVAQVSGGRYLTWEESKKLLDFLPGRMDITKQVAEKRAGESWLFFLLFILACTADWFYRHRLGLP